VILDAFGKRAAQAGFVGAAVGRRNGVAVGRKGRISVGDERDRPFDRAVAAFLFRLAGEDIRVRQGRAIEGLFEIVFETVLEM
jgi:hypothetical protein